MNRILHIIGSPRANSASREIGETLVDRVRKRHPNVQVDVLDVWSADFPAFDEEIMNAKYADLLGVEQTLAQKEAWAAIGLLAARVTSADLIIVSTPMWNFGIPYRLKMLIDTVTQNGHLFRFDPATGFTGMATGRAVLVCARGINFATGSHTPEAEFDFQKSYMRMWLKMIGITDVEPIILEQLLFGSEADSNARLAAKAQAHVIAERL